MAETTSYTTDDERSAIMGGEAVSGWVIRRPDGEPAYFQIKGRGGFCVPIEKVDLRLAQADIAIAFERRPARVDEGLTLIRIATGEPVKVGDEVMVRGEPHIIEHFVAPTGPRSKFEVTVRPADEKPGPFHRAEYGVQVVGLMWIKTCEARGEV